MLTFVKRKYFCNDCKLEGSHLSTIKNINEIPTYLSEDTTENIQIERTCLYTYIIVRDPETDVVISRKISKVTCEHCESLNISPLPDENYPNVLNFYPPSNQELWYRGFEDLGYRN